MEGNEVTDNPVKKGPKTATIGPGLYCGKTNMVREIVNEEGHERPEHWRNLQVVSNSQA